MEWIVEYFQEESGSTPGEIFERTLDVSADRDVRGLLGPLLRWAQYAAEQGPTGAAGGHFEKCRTVEVWQLKASRGNRRGRWFFCWDEQNERLVLLSGIVKEGRQATPPAAYVAAQNEWNRYKETRRVAREDA